MSESAMLSVLENLKKGKPRSEGLKVSRAFHEIGIALGNKDGEGLSRALEQLKERPSREQEEFLLVKVIDSDWPEGFDRVVGHFGLKTDTVKNIKGYAERSMLETLIDSGSFSLVAHVWNTSDKATQRMCIENYLNLGLAQVLVEVGESEALKDLAHPQEVKSMMASALALLSKQTKGKDKNPLLEEQNTQKTQRKLEGLHGVVKALLEGGGPQMAKCFWDGVFLADSIDLLSEFTKSGMLSSEVMEIRQSPMDFFKGFSGRRGDRIPTWWFDDKANVDTKWSEEAKKPHTFNLAEIASLYSEGEHKILSALILDRSFQEALVESPAACHALVSGCAREDWGVGLLAELKAGGVDLNKMISDKDQNPVHIVAKYYQSQYRPLLEAFIRIHPEWGNQKDKNGERPGECGPGHTRDEVSAIIDQALLKKMIVKPVKVAPVKNPRM